MHVDIFTARKILGSDKIIGISANTVEEAVVACEQGADYLGIGTIFSTQTYVLLSSHSEQYAHICATRNSHATPGKKIPSP